MDIVSSLPFVWRWGSTVQHTAGQLDYGNQQILLRVWNAVGHNHHSNYGNAVLSAREDALCDLLWPKANSTTFPRAALADAVSSMDPYPAGKVFHLRTEATQKQECYFAQVDCPEDLVAATNWLANLVD